MAGGFEALGLMPELLRSVDELGWTLPTDVQDEAIPLILGGGDVMAASETGSGKTAAFCLPIIQCVHERLREDLSKGGGGPTGPPDVRLSDSDRDAILTISADGLTCNSTAEKIWAGLRTTHGVKSGKHYFEVLVQGNGICRLGWSTMAAHHELGKDAYGFGFGGTGKKSVDSSFEDYGEKYGDNDVIGCFLDLESTPRTISYSKNGKYLGIAFTIPGTMTGSVFFPAIVVKGAGAVFNFGATGFRFFDASKGYTGLVQADPTAIVGASSKEAFVAAGKRKPLAIIIEPARDLAEQVYQSLEAMSRYVVAPALSCELFVGGDDSKRQRKALSQGVDIVVGTPGKLVELLQNKTLDLAQIRFFVLDEADRLVDGDSLPKIMQLFGACPAGGTGENRLQVCFFSATLHSREITELSQKICINPTWVDLKGVDAVPETVHHVVYRVDPANDKTLLATASTAAITDDVHTFTYASTNQGRNRPKEVSQEEFNSQLIKEIKLQVLLGIIDKFEMSQCMIFCRTNVDCDNLEAFLNKHGGGGKFFEKAESGRQNPYSCCVLAGMRSMQERRRNLEAFRDGDVRFLICTDVAARGIDVKGLPYVINLTLPDAAEQYIHRIGRVGRADKLGLAISLVTVDEVKEQVWYHTCSNRGRGCSNRNLTDCGGCTIWYDEASLLDAVEQRLKMPIPEMDASYELPEEVASLGAEYGEQVQQAGVAINQHLEALGPTLRELAELEYNAQNLFLQMQQQFGTEPILPGRD